MAYHPLPLESSFKALAPAFVGPYLIYVAIASLPATWLPAEAAAAGQCALTLGTLLYFRRHYRFGPFDPMVFSAALVCLPFALLVWIGPFFVLEALGLLDLEAMGRGPAVTPLYFWLRLFNAVVLVAVFEELFTRAYLLSWFYQADRQRGGANLVDAILETLDQRPQPSARPPLSRISLTLATVVFAGGHQPVEYLSAILYYTLTAWLYYRTRSLWACVIVHMLTNLAIALLARHGGMMFLW